MWSVNVCPKTRSASAGRGLRAVERFTANEDMDMAGARISQIFWGRRTMRESARRAIERGRANLIAMATTSFTVVMEREDDGGFSVYVPDLPGCASQGDSHDEALANIREAIELYLDGLKADGLALPEPRAEIATVRVRA